MINARPYHLHIGQNVPVLPVDVDKVDELIVREAVKAEQPGRLACRCRLSPIDAAEVEIRLLHIVSWR